MKGEEGRIEGRRSGLRDRGGHLGKDPGYRNLDLELSIVCQRTQTRDATDRLCYLSTVWKGGTGEGGTRPRRTKAGR